MIDVAQHQRLVDFRAVHDSAVEFLSVDGELLDRIAHVHVAERPKTFQVGGALLPVHLKINDESVSGLNHPTALLAGDIAACSGR